MKKKVQIDTQLSSIGSNKLYARVYRPLTKEHKIQFGTLIDLCPVSEYTLREILTNFLSEDDL